MSDVGLHRNSKKTVKQSKISRAKVPNEVLAGTQYRPTACTKH